MRTLRTFIAIELDEELRHDLGRLQDRLAGQMAPRSVRWVRPEGIHLTLKFLGETTADQVEEVKEALAQAVAGVGPFSFSVTGLGCFPNTRQPRVVWVAIQELTGALSHLRDAIEERVAPLGFPTEKRRFSPHLTLGRVQRHASKSEVQEIGQVVASSTVGIVGEMTVTSLSYIKSELKPSGAVYTALSEAALAGPGGDDVRSRDRIGKL